MISGYYSRISLIKSGLVYSFPFKRWTGVSFSTRRNFTMTANSIAFDFGVVRHQTANQLIQLPVLLVGIIQIVSALQFYAYRIIIADLLAAPGRFTGVPGAIKERYKLGNITVPLDQTMGRYPHVTNGGELIVRICIELVAK